MKPKLPERLWKPFLDDAPEDVSLMIEFESGAMGLAILSSCESRRNRGNWLPRLPELRKARRWRLWKPSP